MTESWLEPVQADIEQLRQAPPRSAAPPSRSASGLRGQGLRHPRPGAQHRRAQQPARQIDGRRDARARRRRLRSRRAQPASPATTRRWPSGCAQAAGQAEQPAELKLREAVFNEGPAGVANAVKNLWQQHRRLSVEPRSATCSRGGKHDRGHTDSGRADHRPRPDRAARHHRHRPGPAGAGDRQSAARAAVDPPVGALSGRSARPSTPPSTRAGRRPRVGAPAFHPSQERVLPRHSEPLQLRSRRTRRKARRALAMNQLAGVLRISNLVRWPQRPKLVDASRRASSTSSRTRRARPARPI